MKLISNHINKTSVQNYEDRKESDVSTFGGIVTLILNDKLMHFFAEDDGNFIDCEDPGRRTAGVAAGGSSSVPRWLLHTGHQPRPAGPHHGTRTQPRP